MFWKHATFTLLIAAINCSPPNQKRAIINLQPGAYQYGEPDGYQIPESGFPDPSIPEPQPQTSSSTSPPPKGREVSVVAHMANTPASIRWGLQQGANGIEFDLNFVGTLPSKFYHGSLCDCWYYSSGQFSLITPPEDNICSSLKSSCEVSTSFDEMTNFLGSPEIINSNLAVIYIDGKIDKSIKDYYEAGKNVVKGFNEKVMKKGFRGQIIISCPEIKYSDYLRGAYNEAFKSNYVKQYFYTIDGQWIPGNEKKVWADLRVLGAQNIVYSVGITASLPFTFKDAITYSAQLNVYAGIGIWTLEKPESIAEYLSYGVNMIVTNTPQRAVKECKSRNINLPSPGNALTPKVLPPILDIPYWDCDCTDYSSGLFSSALCRITKRASYNYACYCGTFCYPTNIKCNPTTSALCRTPIVTLEACKLGGGNCGGY